MGSKWWIVGGRKVKREKESEIVLRALLRALELQSLKLTEEDSNGKTSFSYSIKVLPCRPWGGMRGRVV